MPKGTAATLTALVLAAGQGKRMRSATIKLLHPLWGRPMVAWTLDSVQALAPDRLLVVIGYQADAMRLALDNEDIHWDAVVQDAPRGTGHAVMCARPHLPGTGGDLLILNGDLPLLTEDTLRSFLAAHRAAGATLSVLSTELEDPSGYGRMVRSGGSLVRIVEDRDTTVEERAVKEINCGVYLVQAPALMAALDDLGTDNTQGEYYLTDVVANLVGSGKTVQAVLHPDAAEVLGVNDRRELAAAAAILSARKNRALMMAGVTLLDPARTYIDPRTEIGPDTVIYPDVWIEGTSVLGTGCTVRPNVHLTDVRVGDRVTLKNHCVIEQSEIGDEAQVGPFAHLRPGTYLSRQVKVGNFVETKKTSMGEGSKASHLSYLGDAQVGRDVNVGAGTITCNYDGRKKHVTILEDGVFIGSDTQLVAPVRVGKGAYVGAGSTITEDVPAGALALTRTPQKNIDGWVKRKKKQQDEES
ncbi:MAG: UDP-N-acetylglucosamine diphosphorylase/glucosamine-1-phosphate N-acetyltransferase [Acidobacteria bacterium]|nr:MAG: UDP-N-acetylglucosamine diphosphorylase/glucosamine-1-phosphate N-acetyltransferase [Acidobacteriota bacterium]